MLPIQMASEEQGRGDPLLQRKNPDGEDVSLWSLPFFNTVKTEALRLVNDCKDQTVEAFQNCLVTHNPVKFYGCVLGVSHRLIDE